MEWTEITKGLHFVQIGNYNIKIRRDNDHFGMYFNDKFLGYAATEDMEEAKLKAIEESFDHINELLCTFVDFLNENNLQHIVEGEHEENNSRPEQGEVGHSSIL